MIETLHIRNFAPAENLTIEFQPGFNVITGETGAGKSILIGALGLALGERADKNAIRAGAESCSVEAAIAPGKSGELKTALRELGIAEPDSGQIIIRRSISASGASKAFVNDTPVTAAALKRIGDALIDMHGPHEHQSLFLPDMQLKLLDAYGGAADQCSEYIEARAAALALERELKTLAGNDPEENRRRLEELSFQAKEIRDAGISDEDESAVSREHSLLANAQLIVELAQQAQESLAESDYSAFSMLVKARQALSGLAPLLPEAAAWIEETGGIASRAQELARDISALAQSIEADPGRMQWVEDRMSLYARLKRKYGRTAADVLEFAESAEARLKDLENMDETIRRLESELRAASSRMRQRGLALREARLKAAKRLSEAISRQIRDLGFMRSEFSVKLDPSEPGPLGMDQAEFMFAPNVGEPAKPVRLCASSGEISRVMLAVKSVLAGHDRVPVLVFDEIDVNLGGKTADAVGAKLAGLAAGRQVLCITHLAQVARHADTHFLVEKQARDGRVFTSARRLGDTERAEEIARMLGGAEDSELALAHAREMLERAPEVKRRSEPRPRKQYHSEKTTTKDTKFH